MNCLNKQLHELLNKQNDRKGAKPQACGAVFLTATPVAVHDVHLPTHVGLGEGVVIDHIRPGCVWSYLQDGGISLLARVL